MSKRHDDIINSIMFYGRFKVKQQAEDWAIKEFGSDWRSRKAPKSKRIMLKESNEKEDDNELPQNKAQGTRYQQTDVDQYRN